MENELDLIFNLFNKERIKYFILRDYHDKKTIYDSLDIDLFIHKSDLKRIKNILFRNGWYCSNFNDTKYPHIQFYKLTNEKNYKLDFVYGLYYGKQSYKYLINLDDNKYYNRSIDNIKICREDLAIDTMLLHIIFDKECFSEKNFNILKQMYDDYINSKYRDNQRILPIDIIIDRTIDENNNAIFEYKKKILLNNLLKSHIFLKTYNFFTLKILSKIKRVLRLFQNNSIALIGVDGSGKSSIVESINALYGDKSMVVYMGMRDFKLKALNRLYSADNLNIFEKIEKRFLIYFELLNRFFSSRFTTKLVIFDRYSDDVYVNSSGIIRKLSLLLFKYMFPQPKIKFYAYCSCNTSFERKDDIYDKDGFIKMKQKYDSQLINNKHIKKIDTDKLNRDLSLKVVITEMNDSIGRRLI